MSLDDKDLKDLLEVAKKAALAGGACIERAQGGEIAVQKKEGGENLASQVVTEVDLQAEKAILEVLQPSLAQYDLGLLTEESTDDCSRFEKEYFWCIDPLDGTLAFSRNQDGYSASVGLVSKGGVSVVGAIYDPRGKVLYSAMKGAGTFANDQNLKVREGSNTLTILVDPSFEDRPDAEDQIEKIRGQLSKVGLKDLKTQFAGGAAMAGIRTIECAPAIYFKFPKKAQGGGSLWDFAAVSVIQAESGGVNSDFFGEPIELNREESTFLNHKGVFFGTSDALRRVLK